MRPSAPLFTGRHRSRFLGYGIHSSPRSSTLVRWSPSITLRFWNRSEKDRPDRDGDALPARLLRLKLAQKTSAKWPSTNSTPRRWSCGRPELDHPSLRDGKRIFPPARMESSTRSMKRIPAAPGPRPIFNFTIPERSGWKGLANDRRRREPMNTYHLFPKRCGRWCSTEPALIACGSKRSRSRIPAPTSSWPGSTRRHLHIAHAS